MEIINKPDALSMSGNMNQFVLSTSEAVAFKLKEGNTLLLQKSYESGPDGRITIDIKDIVESRLNYILNATQSVYTQPGIVSDFTADINGSFCNFRVIRAGVFSLSDTASNWLRQHFLTWQPRVKAITYYSPEWLTYYAVEACTAKLKATYPDKSTRVITLQNCPAGSATTFNLQYSVVAGKLGNTYPSYYEVWTETSGGTKLSESQMYVFSEVLSENEQWYLFENTLGGLDTFRASGSNNLNAEHEHSVAEFGNIKKEYQVDTQRKYVKNTGYLDEYSRRWLLDFFPSRAKYVYDSTAIRKIVVTESSVTYVSNDLPSSYTFTWQLAEVSPYLNLVKNESDIPDNLVVPDLSSPDFIIPPRLAEYPRVQLTEGVLIPAFDPSNSMPTVTTLGQVHDIIKKSIVKDLEGMLPDPGGGGSALEIIETNDPTVPTDKNVYSAARSKLEDESKLDKTTTAKQSVTGEVDFKSKLKASVIEVLKELASTDYMPGPLGTGFKFNANGELEATSLILRSFLEAPEYRYNRIQVVGGELYATNGSIISDVQEDSGSYNITLKIEEGDHVPFMVDDILLGSYLKPDGFFSSYMRIIHMDDSAHIIKCVLGADSEVPGGKNHVPVKFMNLAHYGNFMDVSRQSSIRISSKDKVIILLDGVNSYKTDKTNIAFGVGAAKNFPLPDNLPINPDQSYLYARGIAAQDILRLDYQGRPVQNVVDRGIWSGTVSLSDDPYRCTPTEVHEVWHESCKYRCIVDQTQQEPRWNATDWVQVAGDPTLRLELDSSNGTMFLANQVDTIITAFVYKGVNDITSDIKNTDWEWTRQTDDPISDVLWNSEHANSTGSIHLTGPDLGLNILVTRQCTFTCTAYVRDNNNTRVEQISKSFDI